MSDIAYLLAIPGGNKLYVILAIISRWNSAMTKMEQKPLSEMWLQLF